MDLLKGKQIMVWTFMGNARMYQALRDYGDRISQVNRCEAERMDKPEQWKELAEKRSELETARDQAADL